MLFFDAGNAWLEGQTFNPFKMRASAGVELRMFLPIFQAPLRFIYGINLDPKIIKGQNGVPLSDGQESERLPVLHRDDFLEGAPGPPGSRGSLNGGGMPRSPEIPVGHPRTGSYSRIARPPEGLRRRQSRIKESRR